MAEKNRGTMEKMGAGMGGLAGRAADTAVDLMGSMIGSAARLIGGWWSDRTPDEVKTTFGEPEDQACRTHFQQRNRSTTQSYDAVRPLYQFGHMAGANPDYQGRTFEEVEPSLRTAWTGDQAKQYGDWESVRDYISTGYTTRHG